MTDCLAHPLILAASGLRLASPLWLLAIAALPLAVWLRARARVPVLLVPFAAAWHRSSLAGASQWTAGCVVAGLVLVIGALARPQQVEDKREVRSQGYDIILAVDLSGSMLSEDYEKDGQRINRLQAIKPVIQAFIERRTSDRIGVVVFSSRAYTLAPLTTDHAWLARQIERVKIGLIRDGTAIGDALGVALSRLDQPDQETAGRRKGAFIVLLTDGANNMGAITPLQSAQLAKARSIPIYTIGAGKDGLVPYPNFDENGKKVSYSWVAADLDEDALRNIAETTGGKFYRAADTDTIESAFKSIDQSQKIEFQAKSYLLTTELFSWFAVPGLALFVAGALLTRPR
ncbi:MAG TPA: VWA domain-containing protein [Opitutaceae bacterium]